MRIFTVLFFLCLSSLSLSSCADLSEGDFSTSALPSGFTSENLMKVHQGMTSEEVLAMFGEPKSVDVSVCGMPPKQWNCTTWEYGEFPYDRASFTFSGKHDSLRLNNFSVDR
jgi:hypothetical protein